MFSVVIPAHNEANYIAPTLEALLAQDETCPDDMHVIVASNGCEDDTVSLALGFTERFEARGWKLTVLDIEERRKTAALNAADKMIDGGNRVYLDADVCCSPPLLGQVNTALNRPDPIYVSGTFTIAPPKSWASRHYAKLWMKVPFNKTGVPGAGLFAVNPAGRARWDAFPDIIADDLFARLSFSPSERVAVPAPYAWVLAEGFGQLVGVRSRWDAGTKQLMERFPHMAENEVKAPVGPLDHVRLFLGQPVSYVVYVSVALTVKRQRYDRQEWKRGRN